MDSVASSSSSQCAADMTACVLADEEEAELARMQQLLCVPPADTKQAKRDILGRIYAKVLILLAECAASSALSLCIFWIRIMRT